MASVIKGELEDMCELTGDWWADANSSAIDEPSTVEGCRTSLMLVPSTAGGGSVDSSGGSGCLGLTGVLLDAPLSSFLGMTCREIYKIILA